MLMLMMSALATALINATSIMVAGFGEPSARIPTMLQICMMTDIF